jgi:ribose transport system permease protein
LASGLFLGLLNGLIITIGRCVPFIVTLAGLVAYRSIALALAEGGEIRSNSPNVLPALGDGGIPIPGVHVAGRGLLVLTWPMLAFIAVALAAGFLLNRTVYGRHLLAVGANPRAARFSAIPINRIRTISYVIMGLFVGIAAIGETGRLNTVPTSQMGLYYELDAIAAVVIGGTSMAGGRGRIWSTVVGVLILGIITNMLLLIGVSVYWQGCVKGAIILIAVLLQRSSASEA